MSDTATVPTDEQLKEYADGLDPLYSDILAAFQFAEPIRHPGEGVYESTIRNYLRNLSSNKFAHLQWLNRTHPSGHYLFRFSQAIQDYADEEFSAAVDRLIDYGFIEPRNSNGLGLLVPTQVGERLIGLLTDKREPLKDPPAIQKPNWR